MQTINQPSEAQAQQAQQAQQLQPSAPPQPKDKSEAKTPIVRITRSWRFSKPPANTKLLLLTIAGVIVTVQECGQLGAHFVAWCLPHESNPNLH